MPARVLVTTRAGGRSAPPYDANNLAVHVGDAPATVAANRQQLADEIGVERIQFMRQAHGAGVAVIDQVTVDDVADVDVLVTATRGLAIAVLVADCVPLALLSPRAVAVVHAGRRGIAAGVVPAAVTALRNFYDGPISAIMGAAICGRCYEVPAAMQEEIAGSVPAARSTTAAGTPALDLPAAVRSQLLDVGIKAIDRGAFCTYEDDRFYSHRRDGVTGRFAMVAMLSR